MDLITIGLIGATGLLTWETTELLKTKVDKVLNIWGKLELDNYKITSNITTNLGARLTIEILPKGTVTELEQYKERIEKAYRCKCIIKDIPYSNNAEIELITKDIQQLNYEYVKLPPTSLLLGYDTKGNNLIVDMIKTPHVGVMGLSNMGKSKCIEIALKNVRGADIILLNTFKDDFKGIRALKINGNDNILKYLKNLTETIFKRNKPMYIVIDEINVLNKKINEAIADILKVGRHYNIFIIAIGQILTSDTTKYKQLFNCRLCFKCIEHQTLNSFIGASGLDNKLQQQDFHLLSDNLYKGRTFNI